MDKTQIAYTKPSFDLSAGLHTLLMHVLDTQLPHGYDFLS